MANNNRKILDLKRWEQLSPAPSATVAGSFIASSRHFRQQQLYVNSNTTAWMYLPEEDGWIEIPSPALAGTFGAGAAGVAGSWSTGTTITANSLTATGGTTSTIVTNQTLARSLAGYKIHILAGPNAGLTLDIVSNTVGANATITVATQASAFSASTVYRLCTPVWYVNGAGTTTTGSFKKYDWATNTWTNLANTGLPATIGTDSKLITTPSFMNNAYLQFATGTATAGGASTITRLTANWAANQWANYQIRITGGTGAGQIRTISSNTATQITVGTAWTTQPDATSTYSIEGNDDFIYYIGSGTANTYRYSITSNTWTTLTPTAARAAAPGAGMSAHWIYGETSSAWTNENSIINGQRIYSFRGTAGAVLDYYDIAANTWVSAITYAPATVTFTTGTKYTYINDKLYIQKEVTNRWFAFDFAEQNMTGWTTMPVVQSTAIVGDTAFDVTFYNDTMEVHYVYMLMNTSTLLYRQMII